MILWRILAEILEAMQTSGRFLDLVKNQERLTWFHHYARDSLHYKQYTRLHFFEDKTKETLHFFEDKLAKYYIFSRISVANSKSDPFPLATHPDTNRPDTRRVQQLLWQIRPPVQLLP